MTRATELLEERGFVWFRNALPQSELRALSKYCDVGTRPGTRPEPAPELLNLLSSGGGMGNLASALLTNARPVRLVAFNKTKDTNWSVPWHQDRVIAVEHRCDKDGYANWVRKEDYWHVEPPESVMREMVFARICFDQTSGDNGALQLAVGSHRFGTVSAADANSKAESCTIELCDASPGDVLFVKALTLHRSPSALHPSQRRALRVDYANIELPTPLCWALAQD